MENLHKYIKQKDNALRSCIPNFESIFHIIHDQKNRIFAEYIDMFQVKTISYAWIKEYSCKIANFLINNIKVPKGSFVGLYMDNSLEWVGTFWGLLMSGYKPLLLNTKLPNTVNEDILSTMKSNTIVVMSNVVAPAIHANIISLPSREEIERLSPLDKPIWEDEIALCTTASTLNYKVCVYAGKNMMHQLLNAKDIIKMCPRIKKHYKHRLKLLAFLPFYHIFGLVATYLWFSLFGRTMVFLENYSADTILYTTRKCEVTHIFSIPLFWNTIAKEISKGIFRSEEKNIKRFKRAQKFSLRLQNLFPLLGQKVAFKLFKQIINCTLGKSIKCLVTGGGYISNSTLSLFNSLGYPLANGYGTSEVGIVCLESRKKPKSRILGSVGKPLGSVDTEIRNNHLYIKGQSTCKCFYFKDGQSVVLDGNWFDTLDVAHVDNKHNLYIDGRFDDVIINVNGEKINPDLIEKQLLFNVVSNYVIMDYDSKTSLIIQINRNINPIIIKNISKEVTNNVNKINELGYGIQSVYFTYDSLTPPNAIKVSRKQLKRMLENKQVTLYPYNQLKEWIAQPKSCSHNSIAICVAKIYSDILDKTVTEEQYDQHFFLDLGGTSIDYCTCIMRVQNEFNTTINLNEKKLFSVNDFVGYLMNTIKE